VAVDAPNGGNAGSAKEEVPGAPSGRL